MVTFSKSDISKLENVFNLHELLEPLTPDWISVDEAVEELKTYDVIEVANESGELLGFFMYEVVGASIETHAFIPKINRNRSMEILKAYRSYLTDTLNFERVYTTVSGNFKYIVRVLSIIGFKPFNTEFGVVSKNGKLYNLTHMEYIKE